MDRPKIVDHFGLEMHALYEINEYDHLWKKIEYKDLLTGAMDPHRFETLKKRIYTLSHPKV